MSTKPWGDVEHRYAWGDWVRLMLVEGQPVVKVVGLGMGGGLPPYVQVDWGDGLRNIEEQSCEPFESLGPGADLAEVERWLAS